MIGRHLRYVVTFALLVTVATPQAYAQGRGRGGRGAPPASRPARPAARVPPPVAASPPAPATAIQKAAPGQLPRGYQEPAFARGYADGFTLGHGDNRGGKRYDPVGHRDYRDADQAYYSAYGSRDAYKNNYRAGFRQGYEDGYRAK